MSAAVPPVDRLLPETPQAGGTAELDELVAFLGGVERGAADCSTGVSTAAEQLGMLSSRSVQRIESKLRERVKPGSSVLERSAARAAQGFAAYASEVGRIHLRAGQLISAVERCRRAIATSMQEAERLARSAGCAVPDEWSAPPGCSMPAEQHPPHSGGADGAVGLLLDRQLRLLQEQQWAQAVLLWERALEELRDAASEWRQLVNDRDAAERALLRALEATPLGQLLSLTSGSGPSQVQALATIVSGECRGITGRDPLVTDHPLLPLLLGVSDSAEVWRQPPDPKSVAANWQRLTERQRERLITEAPWVVGNLPGVPFSVRDRANRLVLAQYVVAQDFVSPACRQAIDEIMLVLDAGDRAPKVSLVALDLGGEVPLAAIGYGELDTAQNLGWQVPGMFNDVPQALPGWDRASRNLLRAQQAVLVESGRAGEGAALIVFLEYDTPNLLSVLSAETARDAAGRLARELEGTAATRNAGAPLPNLALITHSYGTTVGATALAQTASPVGCLVMLGSAGLDPSTVKSLDGLAVARDQQGRAKVFTTMAPHDGLAPFGSNLSGRIQPNPQSALGESLSLGGARAFSSGGSGELLPTNGHSVVRADGQGYLDTRTESLRNVAAITLGEFGSVSGDLVATEARAPHPLERPLLAPPIGWR